MMYLMNKKTAMAALEQAMKEHGCLSLETDSNPSEKQIEYLAIHHTTHHVVLEEVVVEKAIETLQTISAQSDELNKLVIDVAPVIDEEGAATGKSLLNIFVGKLK